MNEQTITIARMMAQMISNDTISLEGQALNLDEFENAIQENNDQRVIELLREFSEYKATLIRQKNNNESTWAISFGLSFSIGFTIQGTLDPFIEIGVVSFALLLILSGVLLDLKMKRKERSFNF